MDSFNFAEYQITPARGVVPSKAVIVRGHFNLSRGMLLLCAKVVSIKALPVAPLSIMAGKSIDFD